MQITSSAFNHEGDIPSIYTCDGQDISPALSWSGIPEGAVSLALINDDPDAPGGTWVHWVVFNMPASMNGLPENVASKDLAAQGIVEGITSFRRTGYGGPCPPSGTHRYYFKLVALDISLDLDAGAGKAEVVEAMEGHLLDQTELMGRYSRR